MVQMLSLVIDFFQEIALWISVPFMIIFYDSEEPTYEPRPGQKNVVIVERWLYKNLLRKKRIEYLRKRGLNVYGFFDYLQNGTFEDSADRLSKFIEDKGLDDLTLIGISGGGITCLSYLKRYDWKGVDKLISIGTPFYGTPIIALLSFVESARDLLPGSEYLKQLRKDVKKRHDIYCFRAVFDILVPAKSAVLNGSNEIVINVVGHNNMYLLHQATYDKIVEIVNKTG